MYLSSIINIEANGESIGCAEISHLRVDSKMAIESVHCFSLMDFMHLTHETFKMLCIFQQEPHPNRQTTRIREGHSLFGILKKTRTTAGGLMLKQWFLRPLQSPFLISQRLDIVELFSHPQSNHITKQIQSNLRGIKNIPVHPTLIPGDS